MPCACKSSTSIGDGLRPAIVTFFDFFILGVVIGSNNLAVALAGCKKSDAGQTARLVICDNAKSSMPMNTSPMKRRTFLTGAAALAATAGGIGRVGAQTAPAGPKEGARVATKRFGNTGRDVSILSMGGMFDVVNNQILLRKALDWGVTYWDTAHGYSAGKSEEGIGLFFERNPGTRDQVFLVTKTPKRDPKEMEATVRLSLERMKTDHIDLLYLHAVKSPSELNDSARAFGEKAKENGWIRHFGFSTHTDMAVNLMAASKLPWIEVIMTTYNYQLLGNAEMNDALQACYDAGTGLTAMKTMATRQAAGDSPADAELFDHFRSQGLSVEAAKLKAVWDDPRITAICSQMPNLRLLAENVQTALLPTPLSSKDTAALLRHADSTHAGYCAGCARHCEQAAGVRVADAMRAIMYDHGYGRTDLPRGVFSGWTPSERAALLTGDFSRAEAVCPRGLPISRLMREAASLAA